MNEVIYYRSGWCDSVSGNSKTFAWWRNHRVHNRWSICGFDNFCKDGMAVTDDFGNLVEVK